jgi:hypothetical protein
MTRIRTKLAMLGLLVAFVPAAAGAGEACRVIQGADTPDPADDVSVCRQDVWFHNAETPAGNLAAFGAAAFPSWNATKPTGSYMSGAGGAYVATSAFHQSNAPWDPQGTPVFEGTFTGDIDTLAATFYMFVPGKAAEATLPTNIQLIVDEQLIYEADDNSIRLSAAGEIAKKIDFALTNIHVLMSELGLAGAGTQHAIRLSVVGTGLATGAAVFVYDAAEVPSGMVFNIEPENLANYTVIAA